MPQIRASDVVIPPCHPPGFVVRGGPAPKLARAQLAAGVGAEGTAKSFCSAGAQPPRRAVGPTSNNSDAHPRCRPSDRTEVVAPLAQWPPSAARISPGEQLAPREGLSRPSAECAADAENYETGRRHSADSWSYSAVSAEGGSC